MPLFSLLQVRILFDLCHDKLLKIVAVSRTHKLAMLDVVENLLYFFLGSLIFEVIGIKLHLFFMINLEVFFV